MDAGEVCKRLEEESAGNHEREKESGRRTLSGIAKVHTGRLGGSRGYRLKSRIKMRAKRQCAFSGFSGFSGS